MASPISVGNMASASMNKLQLIASLVTFLAALVVIISFATPYWLVSTGPKFDRLGLWEACFKEFTDINYRYDKVFRGCMWIFDEDYDFLIEFLEQPFFIAVQVLFTLGFILLLLACVLLLVYLLCLGPSREVPMLSGLGALHFLAGFFTTIAVIVFGAKGDSRDWMPDPDLNNFSWSFVLGAIGAVLELIAGTMYLAEARRIYKQLHHHHTAPPSVHNGQDYKMQQFQK